MLSPTPMNDANPREQAAAPAGMTAEGNSAKPPRRRSRRLIIGLLSGVALVAVGWLFLKPWLLPRVLAWHHARAARSELKNYHNPQALRHLKECMLQWPNDPDLLILAARAERRASHYAEAERLLDQYQKARGVDKRYSLEELLLSAERGVDRVADQCWRYVEQGDDDTVLILEALIRGYVRQYQLGGARKCLDRWLQMQPSCAQAQYLDGQYQLDYSHKADRAGESFRRAVDLDPEHEEARICLAVALLESHDPTNVTEALKHLEFVRERQPENLSVQVGLAEGHNDLGQQAQAIKIVDGVLAERPDFAPALALRGRLAADQGQFADAENWLRKALVGDPNNFVVRYRLAQCLLSNGKDEEARQLEKESKQVLEDLGRYDQIVTHDLPAAPHSAALQCELGQVLIRLGRRDEGARWLERALHEDPQYAPAQKALTELMKKGEAK